MVDHQSARTVLRSVSVSHSFLTAVKENKLLFISAGTLKLSSAYQMVRRLWNPRNYPYSYELPDSLCSVLLKTRIGKGRKENAAKKTLLAWMNLVHSLVPLSQVLMILSYNQRRGILRYTPKTALSSAQRSAAWDQSHGRTWRWPPNAGRSVAGHMARAEDPSHFL